MEMSGAGLQFIRRGVGRGGDDRFYNPVRARRTHQNQRSDQLLRGAQSDVMASQSSSVKEKLEKPVVVVDRESENLQKLPKLEPVVPLQLSNLEQFLEAVTPTVPAQYLSKRTMGGWRTCDIGFQPYFVLGDLWESFGEWSAYGAGVPLVLNNTDCVVQYYVPYLSGIQIYGESMKAHVKPRRPSEDSDSDFRDSSSDGSSDCEPERGPRCPSESRNHHQAANEFPLRMERLSLGDDYLAPQEDISSDEGETMNSQGRLLFEYLEREPPYGRVPLADKLSDLASCFPELKTLRSCDLQSSSWISVAWYPIYRIPTGPTLKDLDACFLTYHFLHTTLGGAQGVQAPVVTYPSEMAGVPKMSLPVFGLASYKFKGSLWTPDGGHDHQLANSLLQDADSWMRQRQVNHPDFLFFCRR